MPISSERLPNHYEVIHGFYIELYEKIKNDWHSACSERTIDKMVRQFIDLVELWRTSLGIEITPTDLCHCAHLDQEAERKEKMLFYNHLLSIWASNN